MSRLLADTGLKSSKVSLLYQKADLADCDTSMDAVPVDKAKAEAPNASVPPFKKFLRVKFLLRILSKSNSFSWLILIPPSIWLNVIKLSALVN